ncbi:hypothetical protein NOV72_03284 [Caballeronia novacaledonica]|uniref:Uncharacterized protein n=1 Tax=Caballeronia novacaledonica TaxID=1544861 RepID=A0A2U3I7B3_9BURK|nr:hypothetical protein [Caballeronia novacaledonica]SPB16084.1 hypothetical protein NOV72_03284 [Caballeronia novacaledonica]
MTRESPTWKAAAMLSGELMAALAHLDKHPKPCADVRADIERLLNDTCADPVRCAMVGAWLLLTNGTGRAYRASEDGDAELKAFGALVRLIRDRLDDLAVDPADDPPATLH